MTTLPNGTLPAPSFPPESRVRITDLSPHLDDLSTAYVAAQVVLIWPYSSSTRRFSLLLSESGARPLKGRKQVKVTFLNGTARAAQQSQVGIGDTIRLSLRGCGWAESADVISTPGKRVDWDIQFRKQVAFELEQQGGSPKQIHYESASTPSPVQSPAVNGVLEIIQDLQIEASKVAIPYSTPAPRNANRMTSGSYFDSPLDPFSEDKDYVFGRSRKRTKFARPSGDWKLVDDEDEEVQVPTEGVSPLKKHEQPSRGPLAAHNAEPKIPETSNAPDVIDLISPTTEVFEAGSIPIPFGGSKFPPPPAGQDAMNAVELPPSAPFTLMRPPVTPARARRREKPLHFGPEESGEGSDATTTPRLVPMPSPGLPLVSPLIRQQGVEAGYFPAAEDGVSELEASGRPEEVDKEGSRSLVAASSEESTSGEESDDSLVVLDEAPKPVQRVVPDNAIGAEVVEDEDMYGAPQTLPPFQQPDQQSPQRPRDALDVLEEFLQVSSTAPKEPLHVEAEGLEILGHPQTSDDRQQIQEVEPELYKEEIEDVEAPMSEPRVRQQGVEDDARSTSRQRPSRSVSFDGAMDEDDAEPPLHFEALQHNVPNEGSKVWQRDPGVLSSVTQRIHAEVKPAVDEAAQALDDTRNQLPPTPAHTQEHQSEAQLPRRPNEYDLSLLPTPDNTQEQAHSISSQIAPSQEEAIQHPEDAMQPTEKVSEVRQTRRTSQQLNRRPAIPDNMSSPYFTPRKPDTVQSSPPRSEILPPPSPSAQIPSSPTKPITRSQRAASKQPTSEVALSQDPEVEELELEEPTSLAPKPIGSEALPHTGITTSLSYYPPLSSLHTHFGQSVDIIAVAVDESTKPERAKSGPKDYHTTLRLVDPSFDHSTKTRTSVQIFRPARKALPTAYRGDVLILRNFRVQTAKHKWMLLSTDSSAWAVFSVNLNSRSSFDDVTMSGPPVEYGRGETAQVKHLAQWWQGEGEEAHPAFGKKATEKPTPTVRLPAEETRSIENGEPVAHSIEPPPPSPRRTRRRNNFTDNFGNEDDLPERLSETETTTPTSVRHQPPRRAKSKTPARTSNGFRAAEEASPTTKRKQKSPSANTAHGKETTSTRVLRSRTSPSLVHELRDGTKYVDDGKVNAGGVVHELRDGRHYVDE